MNKALKTGFTLTELAVIIALSTVATGLLVPQLSQTRSKLLQQACAANLKQWGMAIGLYTEDYNGTYLYDVNGLHWDDVPSGSARNPYLPYLEGGEQTETVRRMRICPEIVAR